MQKAIAATPVSSLSPSSDVMYKQMETHLYVVKEKNQPEKNSASHLHCLFFGNKIFDSVQTVPAENKAGEPDYFSSYE